VNAAKLGPSTWIVVIYEALDIVPAVLLMDAPLPQFITRNPTRARISRAAKHGGLALPEEAVQFRMLDLRTDVRLAVYIAESEMDEVRKRIEDARLQKEIAASAAAPSEPHPPKPKVSDELGTTLDAIRKLPTAPG